MNGRHSAVTAALAFLGAIALIPAARAQRMGARIGGAMSARAPRGFVRPAPVNGVRVNTNRSMSRSLAPVQSTGRHRADAFGFGNGFVGSAGSNLEQLLDISPNSGFDWEHVNAINQDLPLKALVDPVTQLEIAQAERVLRTTGVGFGGGAYIFGGYPYYPPVESEGEQPGYSSDEQGQAAPSGENGRPQIIVLQQAPAGQPSAESNEGPQPEEQIPDQGELTLVMRSGKQIKALAFTRVNDTIVYITPDGGRVTVDAKDVDADATVRVNQAQGTPLQLPL
jgi:hypothetical protein